MISSTERETPATFRLQAISPTLMLDVVTASEHPNIYTMAPLISSPLFEGLTE